jgi:hypothetical protein
LGEALFVAGILALLVDPLVKSRLATGVGYDLWWALFSRDAPTEFRSAFEKLARVKQYYRTCSWTITLDWDEEERGNVKVRLRVRAAAVNLERTGFKPTTKRWVLSSLAGRTTTYDYWSIETPDGSIYVELQKDVLQDLVTLSPDGILTLHEDRISGVSIPFGSAYLTERRATMYRTNDDAVPLVASVPTLAQELVLRGNALPGLEFELYHTGGMELVWEETSTGSKAEKRCTLPYVAFPGQAMILSWRLCELGTDNANDGPQQTEYPARV